MYFMCNGKSKNGHDVGVVLQRQRRSGRQMLKKCVVESAACLSGGTTIPVFQLVIIITLKITAC